MATAVEAQAPAKPRREREQEVLVWPDLVFIEFISAVLITLTLTVLSAFIDAPLLNRANVNVTPNPSKAPWYFMNLQELLLHMHPALAGVIIPTVMILLLMVIPYIDRSKKDVGIWFGSKKGRKIALWSAIYTTIWLPGLILFDEYVRVRSLVSGPEIYPGWII